MVCWEYNIIPVVSILMCSSKLEKFNKWYGNNLLVVYVTNFNWIYFFKFYKYIYLMKWWNQFDYMPMNPKKDFYDKN